MSDRVQELLQLLRTLETKLAARTQVNTNYRQIVNTNLPIIRDKIRRILQRFTDIKNELDALRNAPPPAPVIDEEAMRKLQEQHDKDKKELQDTLDQANQANADARGDLDKMQSQIKELGDATAEEKAKIMADLEKSRKEAAESLAKSQEELDAIRGQLDAANQTIETITTSLADAIAVITRLSEMIDAIISDGDVPQLEASLNEINTLLDNALLADTSSPGAGGPAPPPPPPPPPKKPSGSSANDDDTPPPPPYDDDGPPPRPPPPRIVTFTDKDTGRQAIMNYQFPMEKIRALSLDQLNKLNKIVTSDPNKTAQLKAMTADQIFDELNKIKGGRTKKRGGARRKVPRKVTRRRKHRGGYVYKSGRSTRRSTSSSSYQDGLSNYKRVQTRRRAVV